MKGLFLQDVMICTSLTRVIGQSWRDGALWGIKPNMKLPLCRLCGRASQPADGLGIHVEIFISPLTMPTFYKQLTILKIIWQRRGPTVQTSRAYF